jgi:hypothetical protein
MRRHRSTADSFGLIGAGTDSEQRSADRGHHETGAAHSEAELLIDEAIAYFDQSDLAFALVTKLTGELMGAIRKSDLESHRHE